MRAEFRVYGDKPTAEARALVREGDPRAAYLVYAKGDEVEAGDAKAYRDLARRDSAEDAPQPGVEGTGLVTDDDDSTKAADPPANKARTTAANK